jgi:cyclic pyranopterin phosphate synthase
LNSELFGKINGRGIGSSSVLSNIMLAKEMGFKVKVNMVVQKGMNEHEILPMAAYFKQLGITLCFIEFMDAGNDNGWRFDRVVTKKESFDILQTQYALVPLEEQYYGEVAKRYRYAGSEAEVGFITSVSESFCSSCTRFRLSSDGRLYTCLFASQGCDLRELLRSQTSDEQLLATIRRVWEHRTDRYSDERTEQSANHCKKINMSYIGG